MKSNKQCNFALNYRTYKKIVMKRIIFMLTAFIGLFFTMSACAKKPQDTKKSNPKILVAYFSATGTTEKVAKMIVSATNGELYKIQPKEEYTIADLDWTTKESRCCRENDNPKSRPEIIKDKTSLDEYDIIYLGYPNWWNGAPRIINTFIETYELKGKTIIPFMTSGGSQIENSEKILKEEYPDINWQKGKLLNGVSQNDVNTWVKTKY